MIIINFIFGFFLFIYSNNLVKCNNETNKIIFFELYNEEDLIIKNIYINKYDDNFNFLIDTMGFISGLILSKKLSYDYILGNTFSPINSYRTFEGHFSDLKLNSTYNSYFPISIFKVYNKINFYDKSIKYNGIIGLALNYTEEVLLDECYFLGESDKYSIMNYLKNDLKIINENIFSIYKDKLILGKFNNYNNSNINYCKCIDNIYNSFIYFFWNCDIENIILNNTFNNIFYNKSIKASLIFDSLLKDYLLSTNLKIANIIINQINNEFLNLNICNINKSDIYCDIKYYDKIYEMNFQILLNNETNIEFPFYFIIKNKTEKYFYLSININEFNVDKNQNIVKIGKKIFELYFVIFDQSNKRIGLQNLENIKISLDEKYNYVNLYHKKSNLDKHKVNLLNLLFFSNNFICFVGIFILFYAKNNEDK